jgi:lysozyme family protein
MVQIMNQPAVQDAHDPLFQKALQFVLHWEGGFVDDPDDLGGRTNKGITQRVYDVYRAKKGVPPWDVKNISDDETSDIYFEEYWLAAKCNHINPELGMALFDTAVNLGDKHALLFMQEATGCHSADGVYGPQTQAAWDSCSVMASATQFCMLREKHYRALANKPGQEKFLKGWLSRLNALRVAIGVQILS